VFIRPKVERRRVNKSFQLVKKEKAAQMLAMGIGPIRVARELSIDRRTLFKWRKGEEFLRRQQEWQEIYLTEAREKLTKEMLPKALGTLTELLDEGNDSARLGAARFIVQLHGLSNLALGKEVAMDDAVFEAAAHLIAEIFSSREDLKKEALVELHRRKSDRLLSGEDNKPAGDAA
jgi:hypothetical protein